MENKWFCLLATVFVLINSSSECDIKLLSCTTPFGCRIPPRDSHVLAVESAAQQFFCQVSANFTPPDTQKRWLLNGRTFNVKSTFVLLRYHDSQLSISHVQTWMGGWFQCCVKDKCSEEILMVVFVPPKLQGLWSSRSVAVAWHSTIKMTVEIMFYRSNYTTEDINHFHFRWTRNRTTVNGTISEVDMVEKRLNKTLTKDLVESNDSGCYQLEASNGVGHWVSNQLCIDVRDGLPLPPQFVQAEATRLPSGHSVLNIHWTGRLAPHVGERSHVQETHHYLLQYRLAGDKTWTTIKTMTNQTQIANCIPCMKYEVAVQAVNSVGASDLSSTVQVTTIPNATSLKFSRAKGPSQTLLLESKSGILPVCIPLSLDANATAIFCKLQAVGQLPQATHFHYGYDRKYAVEWKCLLSTSSSCNWSCPTLRTHCPPGYHIIEMSERCSHEQPSSTSGNLHIIILVTAIAAIVAAIAVVVVAIAYWKPPFVPRLVRTCCPRLFPDGDNGKQS